MLGSCFQVDHPGVSLGFLGFLDKMHLDGVRYLNELWVNCVSQIFLMPGVMSVSEGLLGMGIEKL